MELRRYLKIGEVRVKLLTQDEPQVVEVIAAAYAAFRARPGKCRWQLEVARAGKRFAIIDETGAEYRVNDAHNAWLAVDRLLRQKVVAHEGQKAVFFHAGAMAAVGGKAALLLGESGQGKSSLVCALAAEGLRFFGDEQVRLGDDKQLHAYPRLPEVSPSMAQRLIAHWPQLRPIFAGEEHSDFVQIPADGIARPDEAAEISAAVFIDRIQDPSTAVEFQALKASNSIPRLVRSSFNCHRFGPKACMDFMADLVEGRQVLHLRYHDLFSQSRQIAEGLKNYLR